MKFGRLSVLLAASTAASAVAIAENSDVIWTTVKTELTKIVEGTPMPTHPLERLEENEKAVYWDIAAAMYKINMSIYAKAKSAQPDLVSMRDAHAKGHGCVVANLEIANEIPDWAQSGIFAKPGHVFPAIVRFSNGTQEPGHADTEKDARGMAVKLIDQENLKTNLLGTGKTQDFLLINSERFFIRNLADYLGFHKSIILTGTPKAFIISRVIHEALGEELDNQTTFALVKLVEDLGSDSAETKVAAQKKVAEILKEESKIKAFYGRLGALKAGQAPLESVIVREIQREVNSSFDETYHSMSSYRLKSGVSDDLASDTAVKYIFKPISCTGSELTNSQAQKSPNFLRDDLILRAGKGENCFAFMIKPLPAKSLEEKRTLVEDSRLRFESEPIQVGTLRIAQQDISSDEKARYCENLSFNPWQSQAEHQPLGSMNRARRFAVTASSIRRHFINNVKRAEPQSTADYTSVK